MKELEEIFENKIDDLMEEGDAERYNNFRHKEIIRTKENTKQRENILKTQKKKQNLEKKKFMIEEKLKKKKLENEKNKESLYKLSFIENFFISIFKKIPLIRESKMIYQISFLYIFFGIIFIFFAVNFKYSVLTNSFENFFQQNYQPYIEGEIIKIQNEIKKKSDEKNNKNMISALDDQMLFMEIFTKEIINKKILKKNKFEINDDSDNININYEENLGDNFKITDNIKNMVNTESLSGNNNLKNLIFYYYNFVPVLYQNLEFYGMKALNYYFIGNDPECNDNNINNLFFKYPLESNLYGRDIIPSNIKIYDYIIDPFIPCNNGFDITDDEKLIERISQNNWYSKKLEQSEPKEINFRLFKLMKINQIQTREEYYIAYNKYNISYDIDDSGNNKDINFLFVIRLSEIDMNYPFIKYNDYDDTLIYDFLSIYNFEEEITKIDEYNFPEEKNYIYDNDYDIDEGKNIIFKNPKFIENLKFFGIQKKSSNSNNSSLRILTNEKNDLNVLTADNDIMVKYEEIENIYNNYDINYYYKADIIYFKLIYFFNQFLQYKKNHPAYLISEEDDLSINSTKKNSEDVPPLTPCSISDIDEYYNEIKSKFDYDCIYDYCFFHNCEPLDSLNIERNNFDLPNCYCLPLFCKDENTKKNSEFEKKIRKEMGKSDDENFDYSYTSKYNYFLSELQTSFSNVNEYFNRYNFNFRCQIEFNKKNIETNKIFTVNINQQEYKNDNIFLMHFYNSQNIKNTLTYLEAKNASLITMVITIYIALCIALSIGIFFYVFFSCNKLINKMNQVNNLRKLIISNANSTNNNENKENSEINDNNNDVINNNETEILIKDNDDNNKNNQKLDDNSNNKDSNNEEDELDELIKLINQNLSTFKIEFNLNEEINDNLNNIKQQYEEIIQVNKLKNKLLLKDSIIKKLGLNNINTNQDKSFEENENSKKSKKMEDLSVNIFCELLSLSNPQFDFSNIKTNFYFKENNDNSLYGLKNVLENGNEGNGVENVDIVNIEKLKNALEHYALKVHDYWKNFYEIQKNKDEI